MKLSKDKHTSTWKQEKSNANAEYVLLLESAEDREDPGFAVTTASVSNVMLWYRFYGRRRRTSHVSILK